MILIWGGKKSRKGNLQGEYGVEETLKIKEELLTTVFADLSSAPHPNISITQ